MLLHLKDRKISKENADLTNVSINNWVLNYSLRANEQFQSFGNAIVFSEVHKYFFKYQWEEMSV